MPVSSDIQILYDGSDITDKVVFSSATFEAQASGGVGTFSITLKDTARTLSFVTGKEVLLVLDGTPYFGGYLMQIGHRFAFPVVNTTDLDVVTARQFALHGTNYNVLFDRLVVRNTADYLHALPTFPGDVQAGDMVKDLAANYLDGLADFDTTSFVDPVGYAGGLANFQAGGSFSWKPPTQSLRWREQMRWVSQYTGAIYYLDAERNLHYHGPENVFSRWGFSDRPNHRTVLTSQTTFTGATYGFREMTTSQDITNIINDIFVWGGSPIIAADTQGESGTVFARRTNDSSIATYGRWQAADVRFVELGVQSSVDARADTIVPPEGSDLAPGMTGDGIIHNASKPDWTVSLVWYAHDVPTLETGAKDHLIPGDIVTFAFYVHGTDLQHPLILTLPLRQVSITFPTLPSDTGGDPKTFARFEGQFGLSLDDPFNLWEAILNRRDQIERTINMAGSPATSGSPGALWQGAPDETVDGSRKMFTLSSGGSPIVYLAGSTEVYVNALLLRAGTDYAEAPNDGTITMFVAPPTGSAIWVIVRLAG